MPMRDLIILSGMLFTLLFGLYGTVKNRTVPFRVGSVLAALAVCLGLADGGWLPYFGEGFSGNEFRCLMLAFGALPWLLFRGLSVSEIHVAESRQMDTPWETGKDSHLK
jgi:hypothetical protein